MTDPVGNITNPTQVSDPDNTNPFSLLMGRQGEQLASEIHGKFYVPTYRGTVYSFSINAQTLPVNAATLGSKMSLYNPPGSGKNLEVVRLDWAYAVATTVVNGLGIFASATAQLAAAGTFTTAVVPQPMNLQGSIASVAQGYSAYTASGTPVQVALVGYTGAVTSTAAAPNSYNFDGTLIVPPGFIIHVANTVAASTASGFSATITWAEWPI